MITVGDISQQHIQKKRKKSEKKKRNICIKRSHKASGKCSHVYLHGRSGEIELPGREEAGEGMVFALRVYKWGDNNLKPEIIQISLLAAVFGCWLALMSVTRAVATGFVGTYQVSFGCPQTIFAFCTKFELIKFTAGSCV